MPHHTPSLDLLLKLHDSVNEIICVIDAEGRFVYINQASYRIWGYQPQELIGKRCYEFLVEEDRTRSSKAVELAEKGKTVLTFENRYYRKDRSIAIMFWEGGLNLLDQLMYCTGRDITSQRQLEEWKRTYQEELEQANEHLERIADGFIGLDKNLTITYWNKAAESLHQLSRHDVLGKDLLGFMYEPTKSTFVQHLIKVKASNQPATFEMFEMRIGRWLEVSIYISRSGLSVYFRDITSKKKVEEQLQHERDIQQKRITAAVIKAAEEERAHVGKELHDNVNQVLTTVKLYTELCISEHGNKMELLQKSAHLLQDSINEIRGLSKRLSAPSLGNIRLKDSVGELVSAINSTKRLTVDYKNDVGELEVRDEVHVAVYRILQEQFTNILKHANATNVDLSITLKDHTLRIQVADNGKGFNPGQLRKGIGIENMMSRTEGLNGELYLTSTPGEGCVLEFSIPLQTN